MNKYKILRAAKKLPAEAVEALEKEVNSYLADGWVTAGGVSFVISGPVTENHTLIFVCQAVEKSEWRKG